MRRRATLIILAVAMAAAVSGCGETAREGNRAGDGAGLTVAVSIGPLVSLIEPMLPAGSRVNVALPLQSTPHAEELTPSRVLDAAEADLLVYIGGGADPVVERIARARARRGLRSIAMSDHHHAHTQSNDDHHTHEDSHPWLHPHLVRELIPRVAEAISQILEAQGTTLPAHHDQLRRGAATVLRDVDEVDRTYEAILGSIRGSRFISLHGAFDALLMEYGLERVVIVQPGHGVEPGVGAMAKAMHVTMDDPDVFVILEANVSGAAAERLAHQTGARIARLDPSGAFDWEDMMRGNLQAILEVIPASPE